jgi:hypothetical protein
MPDYQVLATLNVSHMQKKQIGTEDAALISRFIAYWYVFLFTAGFVLILMILMIPAVRFYPF